MANCERCKTSRCENAGQPVNISCLRFRDWTVKQVKPSIKVRNHIQADELAHAFVVVAKYTDAAFTSGGVERFEIKRSIDECDYQIRYDAYGVIKWSKVTGSIELHAELFRIITEHYMEV